MNTKEGVDKCAKIVEGKVASGAKVGSDSIVEEQSIEDEGISSAFTQGKENDARNDGFEVVWC